MGTNDIPTSKQIDGLAVIQPSDNGPLLIKGDFRVIDPEGQQFTLERQNVALCRCGHSGNKPFCDGTHKEIHFESRVRVHGEEERLIELPQEEGATT